MGQSQGHSIITIANQSVQILMTCSNIVAINATFHSYVVTFKLKNRNMKYWLYSRKLTENVGNFFSNTNFVPEDLSYGGMIFFYGGRKILPVF